MVITGFGAVSALGRDAHELWNGVSAGRDGIAPIRRFSTDDFSVRIAGLVPSHNHAGAGLVPPAEAIVEHALAAAREARADARLDAAIAPERVAFVMGTSPGSEPVRVFELTERVADALGVRGPRITISTACTSSTNAIGLALDLLRNGSADAVIAGGVDVLTPLMFAGFHALGVLSIDKCAPFSEQLGTTLGEGAGFFVVETRAGANTRGARVRAALAGYGLSGDAFHDTGPDPSGSGVARAMRSALEHARVRPEEVGYVNAHGTGTAANDPAEWRAIQAVFGPYSAELPVSSTKSVLGHAQAAAGVLETLVTLQAMERQVLPQTMRLYRRRPNGPVDPVAQETPRPGTFERALCNNSAFGGANASLLVASAATEERTRPAPRDVFVIGSGVSGDLASARTDLGSLDPSSRHLTSAAALALADAGVGRVRGEMRNRAGLVCGINRVSRESVRELERSIDQRGLPFLSATAFSRMVLNAPAGTCSKALSLRGPLSTVSIGRGSGLLAILYAAHVLAERAELALMVAGGVDEPDPLVPEEHHDGAACVVIGASPCARPVRIAGWAVAGPDDLDDATARAVAAAGIARAEIDEIFGGGSAPADGDDAATSALDFVRAAEAIRSGAARAVLVVAVGGRSASCAVVLDRGGE